MVVAIQRLLLISVEIVVAVQQQEEAGDKIPNESLLVCSLLLVLRLAIATLLLITEHSHLPHENDSQILPWRGLGVVRCPHPPMTTISFQVPTMGPLLPINAAVAVVVAAAVVPLLRLPLPNRVAL